MRAADISTLINVGLSVAELLLRWKEQQPDLFKGQEEKLASLIHRVDALKRKPADYMQKWEGDRDEKINP
jgi:hypothetical protein